MLRFVTRSNEEPRNKKEEITMRKARLKSFVHVMRTGIRKSGLHLIRPICRKQIAHLPLEGKAYSVCQMSVGTDHKALGSGDRLRLPRVDTCVKAPCNDDLKPDSVKFTVFVQIAQNWQLSLLAGHRFTLHAEPFISGYRNSLKCTCLCVKRG